MKDKVNPVAAIGVIVVLLIIVAFALTRNGKTAGGGEKPPGMPADVASEFQKRMGTNTPTGANTGSGANPGSAPASPMPGGYVMPPSTPGGR